jgi:hypothetical protein
MEEVLIMYNQMNSKIKILVKSSKYMFILILIIAGLSSCNLLFSAIRGRENILDEKAQITGFASVPSSDNSVITMWSWIEPPSWFNDDRITEIRIQHSIFGYPDNLDLIFGKTFTDNNIWQHEWEDLTWKGTHYFSLFAKSSDDGKDIWFAPIHSKVKLPGSMKSEIFGFTQSLKVDNLNTVVNMTAGIAVQSSSAPNSVLVVELNVPDNIIVVSASIETFVTSGGITTTNPLKVFPVMRFWDDSPTGGTGYSQLTNFTQDDYAVDDSLSAYIDSAEPTLNDVTEVIQKALLYPPKQIVFKNDTVTDSNVSVFNSTFLNIEYITD